MKVKPNEHFKTYTLIIKSMTKITIKIKKVKTIQFNTSHINLIIIKYMRLKYAKLEWRGRFELSWPLWFGYLRLFVWLWGKTEECWACERSEFNKKPKTKASKGLVWMSIVDVKMWMWWLGPIDVSNKDHTTLSFMKLYAQ
jgi:hypothetical protein